MDGLILNKEQDNVQNFYFQTDKNLWKNLRVVQVSKDAKEENDHYWPICKGNR